MRRGRHERGSRHPARTGVRRTGQFVVPAWGSSPRPVGAKLAVDDKGAMVGSVSGGCVEGAVVNEALDVIRDGKPRLLDFGVSNDQAWEVGLACGGKIQIYVERVE